MARILGLDLGTTSIGWAYIIDDNIIKTGVRVNPLSTDEENSFKKGQSITINSDRTLKRGMRRNLHRYKLRRTAVLDIFKKLGFINSTTSFTETGEGSTHSTYALRAKAPTEKLGKEELVRVFLMINKKRGYKSSRKANNQEEGKLIDGMAIAKKMHQEQITAGQFCLTLLENDNTYLPDFYRSDLQNEFDQIWKFQSTFYPDALTVQHRSEIETLNKTATGQYFEKTIGTERAENKGKRDVKRLQTYQWRSDAVAKQLSLPEVAYILTEIKGEILNASGYLGGISDRSKELYFNQETVGQNLYRQLQRNPHISLKNQVFYRQDYMDEFDAIWKEQSKHYPEFTEAVREELRNITIFYQRPLKSQKGLINICELEGREREILIDGRKKKKLTGPRVAPKSSPIFQEAKIWQNINILLLKNEETKEEVSLDEELKELLFQELNWRDGFSKTQLLTFLKKHADIVGKGWTTNIEKLEGNRTWGTLLKAYDEILQTEGYQPIDFKNNSAQLLAELKSNFTEIGIDPNILEIDYSLTANDFCQQPAYHLWHLLYSYEDDNSPTGLEGLQQKLQQHFGFKPVHMPFLTAITFQANYGNLSVKALRKLMPFLQEGKNYSDACAEARYNHSHSITTEENKKRELLPKLEILQKNSLRNPVVEKILNQMINVVNTIIDDPELGKPDEIRVEMARELKKTAKQRTEMTSAIARATDTHKKYREILKKDFGLSYVNRKDLIKYKLYLELKATGFRTLYSGTYIKPEELFTKKFDVEHIIPQAVRFDDSFSNKTLELRDVNLKKGNVTALDFCIQEGYEKGFRTRIEECYNKGKGDLKFGKRAKLLMSASDITDDFLNRDLGNTAYIARKATELLYKITRDVTTTTGSITEKLRSEWGLINVLQELNWDTYDVLGLTFYEHNREGKALPRIKGWNKRNDHRHHAMDAITVAFTTEDHVQYFNNKNAKSRKDGSFYGLEQKITYKDAKGRKRIKKPTPDIREQTKEQLAKLLVSHKAKNKVVTLNKNKIKQQGKGNYSTKVELTPRGQLHKETVYGKSKIIETKEEKINASFTADKIATVAKKTYRTALLDRLAAFDNDPKKAFTGKNSLSKNPITTENGQKLPEKIPTQKQGYQFTIRKDITPDLKIDKVVDQGVKEVLQRRLQAYNNKPKEAFVNLDKNPIWLNEEKGICIKRVTITGVSNAIPLHRAKDHFGKEILDAEGTPIPADYVSSGNNHHIAIYQHEDGTLDDEAVSFYEAVIRKNLQQPIVHPTNEKGWPLLFTMKQNEMFVFPSEEFNPKDYDLLNPKNKTLITSNLFRVQKLSKVSYGNSSVRDYVFRHHLETQLNNEKSLKGITYQSLKSLGHLKDIVKVRLNHLGDIVQIGEY